MCNLILAPLQMKTLQCLSTLPHHPILGLTLIAELFTTVLHLRGSLKVVHPTTFF